MQGQISIPLFVMSRCNLCGLCVRVCSAGALEMTKDGPRLAHPDRCDACTLCEEVCPEAAIECEFAIVR